MALKYAGVEYEHREIILRNKPQSMLLLSPKGTVPVLWSDGLVLEQSLDIMRWALARSDPDNWLAGDLAISQEWVEKNDGPFKSLLDQYKYPERYPDISRERVLAKAIECMLGPMEIALQSHQYLVGSRLSWVDIAIFPFIRQFARADSHRFESLPLKQLQNWLSQLTESPLFDSIMDKHSAWID
jgi:glutathione S-transferase